MPRARIGALAGAGIYALASVVGLAAFLYPLWRVLAGGRAPAGGSAALLLMLLVALCLVALAFEAGSTGIGARAVALLGMLVALNSILRFAENALPGPGEFSPVFAPIILVGYALGARMGFLMGALTLAVSALITGGVGPWLPYQMLAAGWVGLTAGWLPRHPGPGGAATRREIAMLAVFGAAWGFGYGLLLTLWDWSFLGLDAAGMATATNPASSLPLAASRIRGLLVRATLDRFLFYYATRALAWDLFRAAGNAVLILLLGAPILAALRRFERRFGFSPSPALLRSATPPPQAGEGSSVASGVHPALLGDPRNLAHSLGSMTVPSPACGGGVDERSEAGEGAIHPRAWLAWLLGIVFIASLTRNPFTLAMLLLAVAAVGAALARQRTAEESATQSAPQLASLSLARFACVVIPFAAIYNFLFAHAGTTVVARLPASIPLLGGPLTLESLAYGALSALALVALAAAFATFQRALSAREIVRLVPRAFAALAMICSVALTYIPATRKHIAAVREAQMVRGHRGRGLRAVAPLALPLLVGGLERALALAESMTARGLAPPAGPPPTGARLAVLGGLALVVAGWLGLVSGTFAGLVGASMGAIIGPLVMILGVSCALGALILLGRRAPRSDFRAMPWMGADTLVACAAFVPALLWLISPDARAALAWSPYPTLALPPPAPVLALALLGLVVPAVVSVRRPRPPDSPLPNGTEEREGWGIRAGHLPALPIHFTDFHYTYPDAAAPAVADAEIALPAGVLTLVVGPSGSGKSTLLRAINGLVPHASGGTVRGAVRVGPLDPIALGPGPMSAHVGLVGGDPEAAFVLDGVAEEVAFALEQQGLPRGEMRARVAEALGRVGLTELAARPIDTLSGGERQRVAIAAALALAPEVLVLDEPTSQLDDDAAAAVLDCLVDLVRAGGRTIVVSEHRLDRVAPHAAWVVRLPAPGARPESGPAEAMLPKVRSDDEGIVEPAEHAKPAASLPGNAPSDAESKGAGEPDVAVIELDGVTFGYSSDHPPLLRDVSLAVHAGEIVALTGPSGCGKTTLLRLAVGLLRLERGEVRIAGAPIAGREVADICQRVGFLPQDPNALLFAGTVREELAITLANHGLRPGRDGEIDRLLGILGILDLADRYPRDLSTGQRQRVALGAVLITRPPALLLDEPTRGLDDAAIAALGGLLRRLASEGAAILVATHDRRLVGGVDRVVGMGNRSS